MPIHPRIKNVLSFLLRIGLSAALLIFIFSKIDTKEMIGVLKSADIGYIIIGGLIFLVCNVVILTRWFILVRALDLAVGYFTAARFFLIGLFGNLFLPSAIGGDVIKILGLCRGNHKKARVVASVLLDRLSGFAGISILAVTVFILGYGLVEDKRLVIPILLMGGGSVVIALILFNERIFTIASRLFRRLPKVEAALMSLHHDIALMRGRKKEGGYAIALSVFSQLIFSLSYYYVALGLHQQVPVYYFMIFVPMICVISSLPSIGGLGVREAGAVYLLGTIGVDSGVAVSISLINFLFMVMVGLFGGIFYVVTLSAGRVQHQQSTAGCGA